jgi:hypothetical protein
MLDIVRYVMTLACIHFPAGTNTINAIVGYAGAAL